MGYKTFPGTSLNVFPAASLTRTLTTVTLTSGTSWTVPAGVTYIIATLYAGGGSSGAGNQQGSNAEGIGGQIISTRITTTPGTSISYAIGAGGVHSYNPYSYAGGGNTTMTGAATAVAQNGTPVAGRVHTNGGTRWIGGSAGQIVIRYWL